MAIIDLGKVSITWRGAYDGSTAYTPKDAVSYQNASYICTANTTGNLPTDTSYWNVMAAKGVDGSDGTDLTSTLTTQGDIVYRDGSGLQRLAAGTAGQFLKTQGSGANPVWATNTSGLIQKVYAETTTQTSTSSQSYVDTSLSASITPTSASNKIWVTGMIGGNFQSGNGSLHMAVFRQIAGGGYSEWRKLEGGWYLYAADTGGEHSINLYDTTHNTTGQVDYKVRILSENGSTCRVGGSSAYQTMSLLEIGV